MKKYDYLLVGAGLYSAVFAYLATAAGKKDMEEAVRQAQQDLGMYGKKTILFIDEIHRMNRVIEEYLYPAMEDFRLDIMLDSGPAARSVNLPLRPFTLVGATTRSGLLSSPMRDRFGLHCRLELYTEKEIKEILKRSGISEGFRKKNFENFNYKHDINLLKAYTTATTYVKNFHRFSPSVCCMSCSS